MNVLKDRELNEKESLELITRMIQNSKKNLQVGRGNQFLLWGYPCAIVSLLIFIMLTITQDVYWNLLWLIIPLVGLPVIARKNLMKEKNMVTTYTDSVLTSVWQTVGGLGTGAAFLLSVYWHRLPLMMAAVLVCCAMGVAITGGIIKDKWMSNAGMFSFVMGACMIAEPESSLTGWYPQYLIFSLCFVFMMIIPGHRLNKEKKQI